MKIHLVYILLITVSLAGSCSRIQKGHETNSDAMTSADGSTSTDGRLNTDQQNGLDSGQGDFAGQNFEGGLRTDSTAVCIPAKCPLGCHDSLNRCNRLRPTNFDITSVFEQINFNLSLSGTSVEINADTGEIKVDSTTLIAPSSPNSVTQGLYWNIVDQGAAYPKIGVLGVASLNIPIKTTVQVIGKNALALYVTGAATIDGQIKLLPNKSIAAPGGFDSGASCFGGEGEAGGTAYSSTDGAGGGGGGGGNLGYGGSGADCVLETGYKTAGAASGGTSLRNTNLSPLFGGCGGGAAGWYGYGGSSNGNPGGGGGGALQLSVNGKLTINGEIYLPGAGGLKGDNYTYAASGGGAGGSVLIETAQLYLSGLIAANGGSGGGSRSGSSAGSTDGQMGTLSLLSQIGGTYGGGNGGAKAQYNGSNGSSTCGKRLGSAAGGGGAGQITLVAPLNNIGGTSVSPVATISYTLRLW